MTEPEEERHRQYLVLGIGVQTDDRESDEAVITLPGFGPDDAVAYSLRKASDGSESKGFLARAFWVINIAAGIPLREAYHYAHGIEALATICPFCIAESVDDLLHVIPLPASLAADSSQRISADDLVSVLGEELFPLFGGEGLFRATYGTCKIASQKRAEAIAPYLRRYAAEDNFARGCSYLHLSMAELGIDACDWAHEDYDQSFYRYVSVPRAESAFLNAFKVIESVVGEPSKNRTEQKLSRRLQAQSIDPEEKVGYRHKRSVLDRILMYHPLRDRIAAHGIGKVKRDLHLAEIIELQALARFMLLYPQPP